MSDTREPPMHFTQEDIIELRAEAESRREARVNAAQARVWALQAIEYERAQQDRQWGGTAHDTEHSFAMWSLILTKHVGRLADIAIDPKRQGERYEQAVKIAALGLAMVESFRASQNAQEGAFHE